MSKRIVFNAIFFELATVMYWCLLGNSGSIASKLSIIAINPGHSYVKSRWLSRFYCPKAYLSSLPFMGSTPQCMVLRYLISFYYVICTFLLRGKCCAKIVKTEESMWVNAPFAHIDSSVFTIFAKHLPRSKKVQMHFLVQWHNKKI